MRILALLPLCLFIALVIILGVRLLTTPPPPSATSPMRGKPLPSFALPSLMEENALLTSQALPKNSAYLVNFFASWCVPCQAEHPLLMQLKEQGVVIYGINWKDDQKAARAWLARLKNPYRAIGVDQSGRTAIAFGLTGAPETFLIGADGTIHYHHLGPLTEEVITHHIQPLLP